jgi:hypothetical protein
MLTLGAKIQKLILSYVIDLLKSIANNLAHISRVLVETYPR